mmetsp:Transcript_827/g.1969  ORF Transcript_827/g.1969 Transcript_827/m.1969 type:complete len:681 (-) Transcript_827:83-2125(-)
MSNSSGTTRDTIHISLGPSANAVSAHLLNLYGLAATEDSPICDAQTTHTTEHNYHVPRAFMVDESTNYPGLPDQYVDQQIMAQQQQQHAPTTTAQHALHVETFRDDSYSMTHHQASDAFANFFQTSSILAYAGQSRFSQPESTQHQYKADPSNSRHVVWDDDEDEDQESEEEKRQRLHRQRTQWRQQQAVPMQQKLEDDWKQVDASQLSWVDYLMPPYSRKLMGVLPHSHQTHMVSHWDRYVSSPELDRWMEDTLMERIRHQLEECDYCQGFVLATEGYGIYAGIASRMLLELQEECRSAGRMVCHIRNPKLQQYQTQDETSHENDDNDDKQSNTQSWQVANVQRVQKGIQSGVALHGLTQNAHLVLPLHLDDDKASLFESSAHIALALESATAPFRLRSNSDERYKIGLQNSRFFGQGGMDTRWGSTAQRLSFGEFIASLQPSDAYPLLELDSLDQGSVGDIDQLFKIGTSVERDHRMREPSSSVTRRDRDVPPGQWLNSSKHGGILSPMTHASHVDRSAHHHFALSSAYRPATNVNEGGSGIPQTLTCMMEGMGVRYTPERCVSTVVNQSILDLTDNGYGVGVYWRSILSRNGTVKSPVPVLSTLSNSTRSYAMVDEVATQMKAMTGRQFKGFYNRDVMNGVLPETEDCDEALSYCLDLRDAYTPPGLDNEDGGFDDF